MNKRLAIGGLIACLAVSLVMLVFKPIPGARHYEYAVLLAAALTVIALLDAARPGTFLRKEVLAFVCLSGLILGAVNLSVLRPDSEIVLTYKTVFDALDSGRNPYTAGTIFHDIENSGPVLGNLNYPPLEIYPYYLAYRIAGAWNLTVLTATMVVIQALCGVVLFLMFPRVPPGRFVPFLPLILLGEVKTTAAVTLLITALVLWVIKKDSEAPRPSRGYLVAILFGLGLTAKFLIIPLMAAYYWHRFDSKDLRSLAGIAVDSGIAAATAVVVMAPFGPVNVLKNTVLFNLVLEDRAALTTFYPNVLSGPFAWLGLQSVYPIAAVALLALAVLAAPKLGLLAAMLTSAVVFLLVAPTPEPQFIPALFFLVVVAQFTALESRSVATVDKGRRSPAKLKAIAARALGFIGLAAALSLGASAAPPCSMGDGRVRFSLVSHPPPLERRLIRPDPSPLPFPCRPGDLVCEADPALTHPRRRPGRERARGWIELAAFSTASTVNYWASGAFPEDRDFRLTLADQIDRVFFLEGWRFDSNQFSLNWSHILAGAIHYQFGRGNGLSWLYSWMMAVAGSTWWEIVGEPKEVISINDQIMTGLGGLATGEPWYQIGHFLSHQSGLLPRALSFLNPAVKLNHWLDRKDAAAEEYAQPGWHDFSLFAGVRRLSSAGREAETDAYFGLHARLLGLPEFGTAGEIRRGVKEPYFSEVTLDCATRGGRAEETRLFTKAVTWGRFVQKIGADGTGAGLILGFGSAFELFKKRPLADYDAIPVPVKTGLERLRLSEPRSFTDKLAILHAAGPVLDWIVFRRDLRLWTVLEAYCDFALVNSYALNDYSRAHDIAGLKTTVFYYGYYYGFGGTLSASARLGWKNLRVHGRAEFGAWGSADVLDRFQGEVTNNAHLADTRSRLLIGAGWTVPGKPLEFFAELESVRRRGRLAEVRADRLETKAYAGLAFSF